MWGVNKGATSTASPKLSIGVLRIQETPAPLYPCLHHTHNLHISSNVYSWSSQINSRVLLGLKRSRKNGKDKGLSVYEDWVHYQIQS